MRKANMISLCGIMTALALALSYAERLLPLQLLIPVPGVKLGLANIVTLLALSLFKVRYACIILLCRCILGAVFGGGITGFLFSVWGGMLALFVMAAAGKRTFFSLYGISVLGAAAHNIGQILAAMVLMNSVYVGAYLPYLMITAVFTGFLIAGICTGILRILPKAAIGVPLQMQK